MKFLKNNMWTLATMVLLFTFVMVGNACAESDAFGIAKNKLSDLFKNSRIILFVIGGFGLVALAFQAIFGKVKWPWLAALAFGLALVAIAGAVVDYATGGRTGDEALESTLTGAGSIY